MKYYQDRSLFFNQISNDQTDRIGVSTAALFYSFDNDTIGQESNYATLNSYWGYAYNSTFTEHGTKVSIPASNTYGRASSTLSATKGKFYWEVTYTTPGGNGNFLYVGVGCISGRSSPYYGVRGSDGEKGSS